MRVCEQNATCVYVYNCVGEHVCDWNRQRRYWTRTHVAIPSGAYSSTIKSNLRDRYYYLQLVQQLS